ncbi:MAG: type III-B CRISPR module-associated protein Cmr5 [candidate division WOR-3 bacterium]|jgi:CRISPR-associated protein Cmr5
MNQIKTLNQKRAKLCLICVERIKLLKEGKWKELSDESVKDFLPSIYDEFEKFKNFDGAKKEAYRLFERELKKEENRNKKEEKVYEDFRINFEGFNYTDDYSSHAKRLPPMIVSNGLIPTLAFYKSKGKDRGQIYQDISEILEALEFKPYCEWKSKNQNKGLLEFLLDIDANTLRLVTMEVLSIANWLKRIVEVELEERE